MLRFDGRVALVTGAGRGLGRSHAVYLASRGAAVVVNDLGSALDGGGTDKEPANQVVNAITKAGGRAIASFESVTDGAQHIVQRALDAFGRLDIVVNNAGILKETEFGPNVLAIFKRHMEVHFFGTVAVTEAAWPHLIASGCGRVVNTTSPTLMGFPGYTPYVAAKGAILAFTRNLAFEAAPLGIKVNAIAPSAASRMAEGVNIAESFKEFIRAKMPAEIVSPVVAYLAHESCAVTGETLKTESGAVQRLVTGLNRGIMDEKLTPEIVAAHITEIMDSSTHAPFATVEQHDLSALGK